MTLANLIRKRETATLANANPAKAANDGTPKGRSLAKLAPLALAKLTELKAEESTDPILADGATATFYRWLVTFPAPRKPLEVCYSPEATHGQVLSAYPDALAAKPFTPTIRSPLTPITGEEEAAIRAWLALIDETDPAIIAEVIEQCQLDADAREYFTRRAAAELDPYRDDRRTCNQCANLTAAGRCYVCKAGALPDVPQRCEDYSPGSSDPDRRPGIERWPGFIKKGDE